MKNRHGSYKKILLEKALLAPKKDYLMKNIELMAAMQLSEFELCTLYILLFLRVRHPTNWLQKKGTSSFLPNQSSINNQNFLLDFIPDEFLLSDWEKEKLENLTAENLFQFYNLKGIPWAVNRAMSHWSKGLWQIKLLTYIPSPRQVLRMQMQNSRCVSIIIAPDEIDDFVLNSRDPLSFVLHDLLHADHFFSQVNCQKGQLGFYALIDKVYDLPLVKKCLYEDPQFKTEFEYVASDMNAYVIHLFKCLKSAMTKIEEKTIGLSLFSEIISCWEMPSIVGLAASRLNTPEFTTSDEIYLKQFFENSQTIMP